MDSLCPLVESSTETALDRLTLGSILRTFLPVLLHLLKLGAHKLRVLWQLAACGTPALGANLFHCPHCRYRHWVPRSCGNRHCPRCMAAKSWQWLEKQTRSLLPITYYHCVFTLLPSGLVRIRHYGILGNNRRKRDIEAARAIFKRSRCDLELQPQSVADKPMCCPLCGKAGIRLVAFTDAAGVLHMIGAAPAPYDSS